MSAYNVLLVGSSQRLPKELPQAIERESGREVLAETTARIADAVGRVSEKGFDAAVCWVERGDELAGVIRIRKTRPDLPILVLTPNPDSKFEKLARQAGATRIATDARTASALSGLIRLSVQSGELLRELREQTRWIKSQASQLRLLAQETKDLVAQARAGLRPTLAFVPLLVEDDPDQAQLMAHACRKAEVDLSLPILRSGEEAIAYLSEPREDSSAATLVLLDVDLPGISGLEVLEWIRRQPKLNSLPVVMLSSSSSHDVIARAYALGANSYLVKPVGFEALTDLVAGLQRFWGSTVRPPKPL